MPREQTIRVYANPYCVLDHEGRPSGAVMFDPVDHHAYASSDQPRRYVGAELCPEGTKVYQKAAEGTAQSDLQDTVWKFSDEAVTLPLSHYYLGHIRSGDLLAADAETADHAGIELVDAKDALARAKEKALAAWQAERPNRALPTWAILPPEPKASEEDDGRGQLLEGKVETTDAPVGEATRLPGSEDLDDVVRATVGEDGVHRAEGLATSDGATPFRELFEASATTDLVIPTPNAKVK